jgi:branched-chain amino acid transport system substrate-binding protein
MTSSSGNSSDDAILIGTTIPKTGPLSSTGTSLLTGYQLGIKHINNNGGIDGREVRLITKDDEGDPKKTRSKLQQIVSNNDVSMLWGSFSSLLVTAGSAFSEQQELPFLGSTFAYMEPHKQKDYEWTFSPFVKSRDIARNTKIWFDSLKPSPPKRLAIWELNTGWGREMANQWKQTFEGTDYEIVFQKTFPVGTSDFTTMISQTKSNDVDAVLSNPVPPDGITAVKQMADQNFAPDLINFVRASDPRAWTSALGKAGDYVGSSGVGWLAGMETTGTQTVLDLYHQQDDVAEDTVPIDVVGDAFGLTQVAAQALSSAGSTQNTDIKDALLNETFDTTLGQFSFEENGMPAEGELVPACGQWYEGDPMLVHPQTDSEYSMETKYPMPKFGDR